MSRLALYLLGPPRVELDGEEIHIPRRKAMALFTYLAVVKQSHSRDSLATLLWPEHDQSSARAELRRMLSVLNRTLGEGWLAVDRETAGLGPDAEIWLDVDQFRQRLAVCETHDHPPTEACPDCLPLLEEAVDLYHDHFLTGFTLRDCPEFDEFQFFQTEGLRDELASALARLANYYTSQGDFEPAIGYARHWQALDPLHEPAHRHLMVLYAQSGQRSAALRQYETCRDLLAKDLGVAPSEKTQETHQRLLKGELPVGPTAVEAVLERELRRVGECPYRGLSVFRESDAPFFFGREEFTERLAQAVRTRPMVAVIVGSSGSGKSSAVFAGLLPRLREEGHWIIADLRPGEQPFHALAAALVPILESELSETDRLVETRKLAHALGEGEIPLYDAVERTLEKDIGVDCLLLLVDQFEELYTLCPEPEERRHFVDVLLAAVRAAEGRRESPFVLLLTMRADFMEQALSHRSLADALQESSLMLGPMTREELRAAIEKPAEKQGAALEAGLVERLLDDVAQEPGNLPLLEFALTLLWERLDYGWMTHAAYEEIGRVEGALARYADQVYDELAEHEQEGARRIFTQLVHPGDETADTRRVATRGELGEGNWSLVQYLADKRLVVTGRHPTTCNETVEVVHEALIQRWGQLRDWMEEDRAFRSWQERLRGALIQWQTTGQDEDVLLRGVALAEAESWLVECQTELSAGEKAFIEASVELREQQAAEREAQRQRELTQVSIGLALRALLELEGPFSERAVLLALEALKNYPYTWQAEHVLGQAVLGSRLRLMVQHEAPVNTVRWSPDGMRILTGSDDGTAKVWDANTGGLLLTLSGHEGPVLSAVWSPSSDRIMTASADRTAKVWDASASSPTFGQELLTFDRHTEAVLGVEWSPDGKRIATASRGGTAYVWAASTGEEMFSLSAHMWWDGELKYGGVAWSPDSSRIVATGREGGEVWDASTGELLRVLLGHKQNVTDVTWSPDGMRIVTVGVDGTARVWDAITGAEILIFSKHQVPIYAVAWSPDSSRIVTGDRDVFTTIWNATTGAEILTFRGHTADILDIAWSPHDSRIATAGIDGTAKVWDLDLALLTIAGPEGHVGSTAWSPGSDYIARGFADGTVKVWDAVMGKEISLLSGYGKAVLDIAWSPSGDRIAVADVVGTIGLWDADTGAELFTLRGHTGTVSTARWSLDGTRIVSAGWEDGTARIWDADASSPTYGAELFTFVGHDDGVTFAFWSPDGRTIATSSDDGTAKIWDPATGQVVMDFYPPVGYGIFIVVWSPDGTRIATWATDGVVRVWDVATGEEMVTSNRHTSEVWAMFWSPTGERILTGGGDGTARVWDANTGAELLRYEFGNGLIADWSPDGSRIAVASIDGSLKVLPTWQTTQDLIDYAKECCVVRELTDAEREQFGLNPR